jgi:glycosyltransferase involved in cell wall biosynthesis
MVGGPVPDEQALYDRIRAEAQRYPNLIFHGHLPYWEASAMYGRARLLVNTSDAEGFPNAYLQAWMLGVPVVTFSDPDGVIDCRGLGEVIRSPLAMWGAVRRLLADPDELAVLGARCRAYMRQEYSEERILAPYLAAFEELTRGPVGAPQVLAGSGRRG